MYFKDFFNTFFLFCKITRYIYPSCTNINIVNIIVHVWNNLWIFHVNVSDSILITVVAKIPWLMKISRLPPLASDKTLLLLYTSWKYMYSMFFLSTWHQKRNFIINRSMVFLCYPTQHILHCPNSTTFSQITDDLVMVWPFKPLMWLLSESQWSPRRNHLSVFFTLLSQQTRMLFRGSLTTSRKLVGKVPAHACTNILFKQ